MRREIKVRTIQPTPWTWVVVVKASGGWTELAGFIDEAAAWTFAALHFEVRMYRRTGNLEYTCLGHKEGFGSCWASPDEDPR